MTEQTNQNPTEKTTAKAAKAAKVKMKAVQHCRTLDGKTHLPDTEFFCTVEEALDFSKEVDMPYDGWGEGHYKPQKKLKAIVLEGHELLKAVPAA